jgi:RHS repeat-associated protein
MRNKIVTQWLLCALGLWLLSQSCGQCFYSPQTNSHSGLTLSTATSETKQAKVTEYRFSREEFGRSSGLYYCGFRFYDANAQRWLTRDPIAESGGMNMYAFVFNRPILSVDRLGLQACEGEADPVPGAGESLPPAQQFEMYENTRNLDDEFEPEREDFELRDPNTANEPSMKALNPRPQPQQQPSQPPQPQPQNVNENAPVIYRAGNPSPSNFKPSGVPPTVSFRSTLSNPWPLQPGQRPVFRPGDSAFGVDTAKLPEGSVNQDNEPPGHVSVQPLPPETFKNAVIPETRCKFPN